MTRHCTRSVSAISSTCRMPRGVSIMHQIARLGRRAGEIQHVQRAAHRVRTLDLGQQDRVGAGPRHGVEVGVAPGRVQPVDAHDQLAPAHRRPAPPAP